MPSVLAQAAAEASDLPGSGRDPRQRPRVRNSLPLCRFRLAAHTTTRSFGLRFKSDSEATNKSAILIGVGSHIVAPQATTKTSHAKMPPCTPTPRVSKRAAKTATIEPVATPSKTCSRSGLSISWRNARNNMMVTTLSRLTTLTGRWPRVVRLVGHDPSCRLGVHRLTDLVVGVDDRPDPDGDGEPAKPSRQSLCQAFSFENSVCPLSSYTKSAISRSRALPIATLVSSIARDYAGMIPYRRLLALCDHWRRRGGRAGKVLVDTGEFEPLFCQSWPGFFTPPPVVHGWPRHYRMAAR